MCRLLTAVVLAAVVSSSLVAEDHSISPGRRRSLSGRPIYDGRTSPPPLEVIFDTPENLAKGYKSAVDADDGDKKNVYMRSIWRVIAFENYKERGQMAQEIEKLGKVGKDGFFELLISEWNVYHSSGTRDRFYPDSDAYRDYPEFRKTFAKVILNLACPNRSDAEKKALKDFIFDRTYELREEYRKKMAEDRYNQLFEAAGESS